MPGICMPSPENSGQKQKHTRSIEKEPEDFEEDFNSESEDSDFADFADFNDEDLPDFLDMSSEEREIHRSGAKRPIHR